MNADDTPSQILIGVYKLPGWAGCRDRAMRVRAPKRYSIALLDMALERVSTVPVLGPNSTRGANKGAEITIVSEI
jgi:hypothetical protein